jgi:2-iminobutanoate/2-iminopropanoate deaminase
VGKTVRQHDVLVSATSNDLPDAVARVLSAATLDGVPAGAVGTVDAAGMRWSIRSWGDPADPPVVVAHGIMSDGGVWWRLGPALAATGRWVIAVDLPGHGGTGPWNGRHVLLETAEDFEALIRALDLNLTKLVVMGHSWGGMVTAGLPAAGLRPGALILIDPPHLALDGLVAMTRDPVEHLYDSIDEARANLRETNPDWTEGDVDAKAHALTRFDPEAANAVLSLNGDWDAGVSALAHPNATTVPVWYLRGEPASGGLIPDAVVPELARRVGADHVLTIAGASHSPMRSRAPESLALAILEALTAIRIHDRDVATHMAKRIVNTPDAPGSAAHGSFAYSQAVVAGGLVFVSGQGPFDPETGSIVGSTIQEQTRQVLRNCDAILRAAGSSMDKVVHATFILRHPDDFAGMNEEWVRWFPNDPPARQGAAHPLDIDGFLISIALVAEA